MTREKTKDALNIALKGITCGHEDKGLCECQSDPFGPESIIDALFDEIDSEKKALVLFLKKEILDLEMKISRARSAGLDYEREFLSGKHEAYTIILGESPLLNQKL